MKVHMSRRVRRSMLRALVATATFATATACNTEAPRVAGDTGVAAPANAVDTANDSVTTGAALRSTDRPIQPPPPDSSGDSTRRP
jgi:hypothetical protein